MWKLVEFALWLSLSTYFGKWSVRGSNIIMYNTGYLIEKKIHYKNVINTYKLLKNYKCALIWVEIYTKNSFNSAHPWMEQFI